LTKLISIVTPSRDRRSPRIRHNAAAPGVLARGKGMVSRTHFKTQVMLDFGHGLAKTD
jgi:hypothetical protein